MERSSSRTMTSLKRTDSVAKYGQKGRPANTSTQKRRKPESVKKKEMFVEPVWQYHNENEYARDRPDPGLVVIFNYEEFEEHKKRDGSVRDVNDLLHAFSKLHYNIDKKNIYDNLTRKETTDALSNLSKSDLGDRNCLICVILSHGGTNDVIYTKDGQVKVEEFLSSFDSCKTLKGVPKIFLVQACKGDKKNLLGASETKSNVDIVPQTTLSVQIQEDVIIVYSTLEGEVSYRDTKFGSWFIQALCRSLLAYGRLYDIFTLLTKTIHLLDQDNETKEGLKQQSVIVSRLNKAFYLCKSKERQFLVESGHQYKEVLKSLKELERKF